MTLAKIRNQLVAAGAFVILAIPPGGEPAGGGVFMGCGSYDEKDAGVEVGAEPPPKTGKAPKSEPTKEEIEAAEKATRELSPAR